MVGDRLVEVERQKVASLAEIEPLVSRGGEARGCVSVGVLRMTHGAASGKRQVRARPSGGVMRCTLLSCTPRS